MVACFFYFFFQNKMAQRNCAFLIRQPFFMYPAFKRNIKDECCIFCSVFVASFKSTLPLIQISFMQSICQLYSFHFISVLILLEVLRTSAIYSAFYKTTYLEWYLKDEAFFHLQFLNSICSHGKLCTRATQCSCYIDLGKEVFSCLKVFAIIW